MNSLLLSPMPTFTHHVGRVLRTCSEEEMIWTNTRRIVAMMTGAQAMRNWPMRRLPCNPVCHGAIRAEPSIAQSSAQTSPNPAALCLVHIGPEPLGSGLSMVHAKTGIGAKATGIRTVRCEGGPTLLAGGRVVVPLSPANVRAGTRAIPGESSVHEPNGTAKRHAAHFADTPNQGRLRLHLLSFQVGATPGAVTAASRPFCAFNYSTGGL